MTFIKKLYKTIVSLGVICIIFITLKPLAVKGYKAYMVHDVKRDLISFVNNMDNEILEESEMKNIVEYMSGIECINNVCSGYITDVKYMPSQNGYEISYVLYISGPSIDNEHIQKTKFINVRGAEY